jgi:hypothetical protein
MFSLRELVIVFLLVAEIGLLVSMLVVVAKAGLLDPGLIKIINRHPVNLTRSGYYGWLFEINGQIWKTNDSGQGLYFYSEGVERWIIYDKSFRVSPIRWLAAIQIRIRVIDLFL